MCGIETPYDETTHIDLRIGYIEGAGQLCKNCYGIEQRFPEKSELCIPKSLIQSTPNDMELGEKVRTLYYEENT